ncbi:unnamed protein product [Mycena citricolor]|uniref:Uncharacterized protein n=1 Tax=Mycena citricolor TaxID=2018698 RepID=A0AAD2JUZ0_9AGAR|nr:unnamed protein product [Mycena citricolor]
MSSLTHAAAMESWEVGCRGRLRMIFKPLRGSRGLKSVLSPRKHEVRVLYLGVLRLVRFRQFGGRRETRQPIACSGPVHLPCARYQRGRRQDPKCSSRRNSPRSRWCSPQQRDRRQRLDGLHRDRAPQPDHPRKRPRASDSPHRRREYRHVPVAAARARRAQLRKHDDRPAALSPVRPAEDVLLGRRAAHWTVGRAARQHGVRRLDGRHRAHPRFGLQRRQDALQHVADHGDHAYGGRVLAGVAVDGRAGSGLGGRCAASCPAVRFYPMCTKMRVGLRARE